MLYKVQEVAEKLGVTRVTVYKKIDKLKELKPHIKVRSKVTYIEEQGIEIIKNSISDVNINKNQVKHEQQMPQHNAENAQESSQVNQVVNLLKEQIEGLNKQVEAQQEQLKVKDLQIERLQLILVNSQKAIESKEQKEKRSLLQWLGIKN